jgi:hypothetical protein
MCFRDENDEDKLTHTRKGNGWRFFIFLSAFPRTRHSTHLPRTYLKHIIFFIFFSFNANMYFDRVCFLCTPQRSEFIFLNFLLLLSVFFHSFFHSYIYKCVCLLSTSHSSTCRVYATASERVLLKMRNEN